MNTTRESDYIESTPKLTTNPLPDDSLVTPEHVASQRADVRLLGGKAAALARLYAAGLPVPPYVVVTTTGAAAAIDAGLRQRLAQAHDANVAALLIEQVRVAQEFCVALDAAVAKLASDGTLFAVRSSAVDEDSSGNSFAGQLSSFLNVPRAEVVARVIDVWKSAFAPSVYVYRRERGLGGSPQLPAVLIQPMVAADAAGVAFSADPVGGRRGVAVVAATRGLGDALVAGEVSGDSWHVDGDGKVLEAKVAQPGMPAINESLVAEVAALARRCAAFFGAPQDIEWAVAHGELWLLQSRPITTLSALPDPDGILTLWDNSNIIESYGGMTTPLTYSSARQLFRSGVRSPNARSNRA